MKGRKFIQISEKELLGHSHINTTMMYLRIVPMNQKKAMEGIKFD